MSSKELSKYSSTVKLQTPCYSILILTLFYPLSNKAYLISDKKEDSHEAIVIYVA